MNLSLEERLKALDNAYQGHATNMRVMNDINRLVGYELYFLNTELNVEINSYDEDRLFEARARMYTSKLFNDLINEKPESISYERLSADRIREKIRSQYKNVLPEGDDNLG